MTSNIEREARIRAAGIVQSVISSGADITEWHDRSVYGLALTSHLANRLMKSDNKPQPSIPQSLQKENV